ncbi:MAG: right-handed parallel beta-helix repeat-containing protein [Pseudomonadota bacterium]
MRAWTVALAALLLLGGCKEGSSGGDENVTTVTTSGGTIVGASFLVDSDSPIASDTNDGVPVAQGGTGPLATLQAAIDLARPGDTVVVRETAVPYRESVAASALSPGGIRIAVGGLPGRPLTIEGFPGERPVLDQGRTTADPAAPIAGFVLECVSHVTIRGFEIRAVNDAGVTTSLTGCESEGLVLEDLHIHDVIGAGQVGGIRLANVSNSVVRNNLIEDVTAVAVPAPAFPQAALLSDTSGNLIEENTVRATEVGIHLRGNGDDESIADTEIVRNLITDVTTGVLLSGATGSLTTIDDTLITGNVIHESTTGLRIELDDNAAQSSGLVAHKNTLETVDLPIRVSGMSGVELFDSIASGATEPFLVTVTPTTVINEFDFIDNNLYFAIAEQWELDQDPVTPNCATNPTCFVSLPAWRTGASASPEIAFSPDLTSLLTDPLFVDAANDDFTLQPGSPGQTLGQTGGEVGAFGDGLPVGSDFP